MSVFQSSSEPSIKEITRISHVFYSNITGLNNSEPDVTVTVTASNRAGQGNMSIPVRLPPSLGKYYKLITAWYIATHIHMYLHTFLQQIFKGTNLGTLQLYTRNYKKCFIASC